MSDTPRTDTASRESTAFDTPTNAINFARQLEREHTRLKAEIDELLNDSSEADYKRGYKRGYDEGHDEGGKAMLAAMQEIYEPILEATAKDSERLDRLQSSHLALYCSTEGEVWRKEGIYKIREYIDAAMEESQ